MVRVGWYFTPREVITRAYKVAKTHSRAETLDQVRHARRRHSPLLWIGIRVGSRTWVNQADGLARLIQSLYAEFPGLGVVFDGFSLPADRSDQSSNNREYDKFLLQEKRVVSDIIERLSQNHRPAPRIFNIIGSSIYDANVWAHAIDVYVSPYGTLQHKAGWLANKPGIIHTNTTVLERSTKDIWDPVEGAVRPWYVPRTAVTDLRSIKKQANIYHEVSDLEESGAGILSETERGQGDPEFDNYELDWEGMYGDLVYLIRSNKIWSKILRKLDPKMIYIECKGMKTILHNMPKTKRKIILHNIPNTVDDKI